MATSDQVSTMTQTGEMTREPTAAPRATPRYIPPAEPEPEAPRFADGMEEDDSAAVPVAKERPTLRTRESRVGVDLAALVLRWVVGPLLVVWGCRELFGWFGGHGGLTLAAQLERLGYQGFATEATVVSVAEIVIGVLLIVGLFTEWACGGLLALSVVAVLAQHRLGSGLLSRPGTGLGADVPGLEVVGGLGVLAVVLALLGAGRLSLDHNRIWSKAPLVTAVTALLLGAAVAAVLIQPQLA